MRPVAILNQRRIENLTKHYKMMEEFYLEHPRFKKLNDELIDLKNALAHAVIDKNFKEEQAIKTKIIKADAKYNQYLEKHNIDKSIFKVKYTCDICSDTGIVPTSSDEDGTIPRECQCLKLLRMSDRNSDIDSSNDRQTFENANFSILSKEILDKFGDTMSAYDSVLSAHAQAKKFTTSLDTNLLITGGNGTGKTYLINSIINRLKSQMPITYLSFTRLNEIIRINSSYNKTLDDIENYQNLYSTKLLIIEDLASEFTISETALASELRDILEHRKAQNLLTIISTNKVAARDQNVAFGQRLFGLIYTYKQLVLYGKNLWSTQKNPVA